MHTFAEAIAISFGLVSVLSARKSIFTVAEHQRENVGELSLSLSLGNLPRNRKSRAAINSLLKRNRFSLVLVSPLSLSNVYHDSFCGERDKAPYTDRLYEVTYFRERQRTGRYGATQ